MKKKILCFILAALMLACSFPLAAFASEITEAVEEILQSMQDPLPVVTVTSLYSNEGDHPAPLEFRAFPDDEGTFYLDIALDRAPDTPEEILVYYRTVDDTAVAKWGDYEAVGVYEDTFVALNQSNGYKARVIVSSIVLPAAISGDGTKQQSISRRFLFELLRVEGNAVLHTADPDDPNDRSQSGLYCHLAAERYIKQSVDFSLRDTFRLMTTNISTDYIYGTGEISGNLNFQFSDYIKAIMATGQYNMGLSIIGKCKETWFENDGPVTFDLYYTYQGVKRKAVTLIIEGEFDDSEFFGWEHAFDAADNNMWDQYGLRDMYQTIYGEFEFSINITDFIKDNFRGYIVYDNDGNVAHKVTRKESDNVDLVKKELLQAKRDREYVLQPSGYNFRLEGITTVDCSTLHYLVMPSNFAFADSYSWTVRSDGEKGEGRKLEDVAIAACVAPKGELNIATDGLGSQLVTTNLEQLRVGDPLRMMVRFNKFAYIEAAPENFYITAKVNGKYNVTLKYKNADFYQRDDVAKRYYWDTFVFECELPPELQGINITSITNIKLSDKDQNVVKSYITYQNHLGKAIADIRGIEKDTRTPVATLQQKSSELWAKTKSFDLYVNAKENMLSRFNDYVTVYYQWSDSAELPTTYSSKVIFNAAKDGEISKNILGTGNGEMYLHIKAYSLYSKVSISDARTTTYDPEDASAVYTPFGPFRFDNTAPALSENDIELGGTLKERILTVPLPEDTGCGFSEAWLYYVPQNNPNGSGTLLKKFLASDFKGEGQTLTYKISHRDVGVGVDVDGNPIPEREEVTFYWILSDALGNTSGRTAELLLVFDTNDYLEGEIVEAAPIDLSADEGLAQFGANTKKLDTFNFIYNYTPNKNKNGGVMYEKEITYAFQFIFNDKAFGEVDQGVYTAAVYYKGQEITDFTLHKQNGTTYIVLFHGEIASGRYDIQLIRTEGASVRVSQIYSVYATDGENDATEVKNKVEFGTLLSNSVYQLPLQYYYKDADGAIQLVYYNDTKLPATFSSIAKAKEYAYYKELGDIYLVQLTTATASALVSGTAGYLMAKDETVTPQEGQYWIRYKSETWTYASGESGWVYYYYGMSDRLLEGAFSANLLKALNTVTNRILGYGKSVILTDSSLILGSAVGEKMLDEYGMPYLAPGQIHSADEVSKQTMCGNVWSTEIGFAADKNIYKSTIYVGVEGEANYAEYPIVGAFALPRDSIFQYMTYEQYKGGVEGWKTMQTQNGTSFVSAFMSSGVYYIREISVDGVSVFAIYIDKEAPKVSFSHTDAYGNFKEIPLDGVEILDIRTKDLYIGSVSSIECDRLSYVAVYKASNLDLVGVYTADALEQNPVKMEDGNYYILVADRSGNHYTVTAKVSSVELVCSIKESTDRYIRLTCNRRNDQILRYEVYLNGTIVTSTYEAEKTFDKAGFYTIYVQDIYGNEFAKDYLFTRNYPTVNWKYYGTDGKYHTYDPKDTSTNGFILTWVSDNQYKISTSVKTRFAFGGDYAYEFIGGKPQYVESVSTETTVTIEAGQSFTLKVYYKNHKDCYTLYTGMVDVTPPSINVSTEMDVLQNGEYDLFDDWLAKGVVEMNDIYFVLTEIGSKLVMKDTTITSDIIKINVNDKNDLSLVEVYLNGELIKRQDAKTGFSQLIVGRWGKYRIVAKDTLGNLAEFTFTNGMPDDFDYFVDGKEKQQELHGYLNFEPVGGRHVYTKVDYGKKDFKLNVKQDADIFMSVGVLGASTEIYGLRIIDGSLYPLAYTIVLDENGEESVNLAMGEALLDMNAEDFKTNKEYLISRKGAHAVYASVGTDMVVSISVYAAEDTASVVSVGARVEVFGSNTAFVAAELSGRSSNISFKESGVQTGTDIHANGGFTVDEDTFESERIAGISLYYSKLNDLDASKLEGKTNVYKSGRTYDSEGFYLLIVRNHYGNERIYRIAISRSFGITASVTFGDGYKIYYSKDYDKTLYSNGEIVLDVLDEDVTITVTLNGVAYRAYVTRRENGMTYLVFSDAGTYAVKLTDSYGNVITRKLEIDKSSYTVADGLLTGYNEKALKRKEGYTNQKLSVDQTVYSSSGIYYLAIQYGNTLRVLYDAFAEASVAVDGQKLVNVIGDSGDGVYRVICRNRYGAVVTKEIHYRGTPTLKLERTIRSKSVSEIYDLSYAISLGFWSNNTLSFSTEAKTYIFTINGSATECPRTLVFENAGDFGSFEYDITYIDEYGFEYSFKAYLIRKNVDVEIPSSIGGTEIDGVLNTKSDISVTFGENIYATYTRNNGEEVVYHAGDVLKKDGLYRFTVIDYAGNATLVTIKKDTAVEFSIVDSVSGGAVQNGGVVNTSKVVFSALNKDSAHIEKIIHNGVVETDITASKFTEDGKWELIVCDQLENRAYFCFYIITRAQNGFAYTTPYEYRITEMWYDNGDGVKISYMPFVTHTDFTSSFDFTENGKYNVVMSSDVSGITSAFTFTVNTVAPNVSLVGCEEGETTINDVTLTGCKVGDRIKIYRATKTGEEFVVEVEITSLATKIPIITEGGKYRIVVESEAGVQTELSFVRKHVMNTAGSIFIMVIISLSVVGLFAGLVYRNKSKTDD